MAKGRNFGILLPVSSLPSGEGIGTLGTEAYNFVDFLSESGGKIWQVLPLNPTNYGDSPYQSCSSDALNYYFIDLQQLVCDGLLKKGEIVLEELSDSPLKVNYGKQFTQKIALLKKAFSRFDGGSEFEDFVNRGEYSDFAVFMALKCKFGQVCWTEWEEPYRIYDENVIGRFISENRREVDFWQFTQFIFLKQWNALKEYAHGHGVNIMGDIPLYVAYDSVEVWKYGNNLFRMDEERRPEFIAGCPPDAFTEDGQLWGNPVYDWDKIRADGYKWWRARIDGCLALVDILRIDHFRGFDRYWAVRAGDKTARGGFWCDGPKEELFDGLRSYNIVAEDLGVIDDGVRRLMRNVGYPGMKVLHFAFGDENSDYLPKNIRTSNCIVYTGTHDNMTTAQWLEELSDSERKLFAKVSKQKKKDNLCDCLIKTAMSTKADTVIIPMADYMGLGKEARINAPSTTGDNWTWRLGGRYNTAALREKIKTLSKRN